MHQSRVFGVFGVFLVILAVAHQIFGAFRAWSFNPTVEFGVVYKAIAFPSIIGVAALFRFAMFAVRPVSYTWQFLSWWLLALSICLYGWENHPYFRFQTCTEEGICYGIYDIRAPDWLLAFGTFYLFFSLVRFVITVVYVTKKQRMK